MSLSTSGTVEEIYDHLEALLPLCERLPPLLPNSSPRSRQIASNLCSELASLHATAQKHLAWSPQASPPAGTSADTNAQETPDRCSLDNDEEGDSTVAPGASGDDARTAKKSQRIQSILEQREPLSIEDVVGMLLGPPPKQKVADREDLAFARLFRELPRASKHDWVSALALYAPSLTSLSPRASQAEGLHDR